ncbi:sensor histidine kinase [Gordonia polyisoprenivorans]|uniref:sensor histidine kinase n=1 Tax=Gordonia polyisoprenivorans TaxID=84595 RepID=UPI000B99E427|nr:histidine kinase [Gordonia polyisoprenivorans]OZC32815.1 two-component sensor histidine kinase [Gordonia polyisoprenivorans]
MRDPLSTGGLTRRGLIIDVAIAVVFALVAIPIHLGQSTSAAVTAAVVSIALALRRPAPSVMIVLALASATVQVATDQIAVVASLAYFPLFATVGGHPDRRVRFGSLSVAIAGCVIAGWEFPHVYASADIVAARLFGFAGAAVVVIGGWAFGFIRYQRRMVQQASIAETIAELERKRLLDLYDEQSERTRLARDMHDVVAHSLAVVVAQAEGARMVLDADPEATRKALHVIADTARGALGDVRGLLEQLRNEDVSSASRSDRDTLFDRMRAAGMTIDTRETGNDESVDANITRVAGRVLGEALTNALKYGDLAVPVVVRIEWTRGCSMTVWNALSDNPLAPGGAGHGIAGMAERAAQIGGTLRSDRDNRDGWLVSLQIPAPVSDTTRNTHESGGTQTR